MIYIPWLTTFFNRSVTTTVPLGTFIISHFHENEMFSIKMDSCILFHKEFFTIMNFHILLCERVTWTSKSNITDCSIFIRLEIRPSAVWAASVSAPVLRNLKRIPLRVKTRFPARLRATIRSTMRTRSSKWTARRTHSKEVRDHCVILIFFFKDLHVLLCGYVCVCWNHFPFRWWYIPHIYGLVCVTGFQCAKMKTPATTSTSAQKSDCGMFRAISP